MSVGIVEPILCSSTTILYRSGISFKHIPLIRGERDLALCLSLELCRLRSRSFCNFHVLKDSSALFLFSFFSPSFSLLHSRWTVFSFFRNSSSSCFLLSQFLNAAWPTPCFCSAISNCSRAALLFSAATF